MPLDIKQRFELLAIGIYGASTANIRAHSVSIYGMAQIIFRRSRINLPANLTSGTTLLSLVLGRIYCILEEKTDGLALKF